jgi:hypothetical protein
MKPSPLVGLAMAASLLTIGAPALAFGANSSNTIAIQHVVFNGSTTDVNGLADFRVSFKNNGPVAVDRVEFTLDTPEGYSAVLEDVGTFSPGVTITHDLRVAYLGGTQAPNEATTVRVNKVDYVDGSVWSAPATPQTDRQAPQPPAIPVGAYAL